MKAKLQKVKNLLTLVSVVVILSILLISSAAFLSPAGKIDVQGKSVTNMSNGSGSPVEKEAALTDYENQVAALINNIRVENGLAPVAADGLLTDVAIARSQDMINRNYFSHYTPEGTNVFNFLRGSGISYQYAGENLAQCQPASIGSPEAFLNAWMNSPSHKANILRAQYGKIGVSMVETEGRRVVTTIFTN